MNEFVSTGHQLPTFPTNRNELRKLYSMVFKRIYFYRIKKGIVLVSIFSKSGLVMHFIFKLGKVLKQGTLTDNQVSESELIDREKLFSVIGLKAFEQWRKLI